MYLDFGDAEVKVEGLLRQPEGREPIPVKKEDATKRYQYLKKSSNILLPLLKFFNDDYVMFIW